jgi:hypothetical protein
MNIFILVILSLYCHILLPLNKSIMSMSPIILGGLEILEIDALIEISLIKILLICLIRDYQAPKRKIRKACLF